MFPYERFLGFLCNAIHNRAKPEANAIRFYQIFSTTQRFRREIETAMTSSPAGEQYLRVLNSSRKISSERETTAPRYLQLEPVFVGKAKSYQLSKVEHKQLTQLCRREFPRFNELSNAFDDAQRAHERSGVEAKFPLMDCWKPDDLKLSEADRDMLAGVSGLVSKYKRAVVGGLEFLSAEAETALKSRSSFFVIDAVDAKDVVHHNYGRILFFCEAKFAEQSLLVARVDIYYPNRAEDKSMCEALHGIEFSLPMVDTRYLCADRKFLMLRHLRGKVALLPPDERLDLPRADRLLGKCFVVTCAECVFPPV